MGIWYDINKCLSYNRLFNFVVGTRGLGKTYGALKRAISRFIKAQSTFIYLRRFKTELHVDKLLDPLKKEFPEHELKVKGHKFYCDDKYMGEAVALSVATTLKSMPFEECELIIFDEFLVDSPYYRYLEEEPVKFLDFYETVNRLRLDRAEPTVLFLANALSLYNPYFIYFNIHFDDGSMVYRKGEIFAEIAINDEFISKKLETRFGSIISNSAYADYAVYNNFYLDDDKFCEERTPTSEHYCNLVVKGETYGIWVDMTLGKMYVSKKFDPSTPKQFCLSTKDMTYNTILLNGLKRNRVLRFVAECAKTGCLYYDSIQIKNNVADAIKIICGA